MAWPKAQPVPVWADDRIVLALWVGLIFSSWHSPTSVLPEGRLPETILPFTLLGMGRSTAQILKTLFLPHLPTGQRLRIISSVTDERGLEVMLTTINRTAACPCCQQPSRRVHSSYPRRVSDVSCGDHCVRLRLWVRKFFCDNPLCARCIFAERWPGLTLPYARRTQRLDERLTQMGCESGGEAAARMAQTQHLGTWSPDAILRLIRRWLDPLSPTPRVLGVDDWAKRKGHTYGTILCDLEQHRVIELLADREAETLSAWLKAHPGVEIVCRDRASAYAEGIRTGAPSAIQIADRFHLMVNLGDAIKRIVDRHYDHLHVLVEDVVPSAPAIPPVSLPNPVRPYTGRLSPSPRPPSTIRLHQDQRRQIRTARWQEIYRLKAEGLTQRAICRQLHTTRRTVRRALQAEGHPTANGNMLKTLGPFVDFLTRRWHEGQHNARQLHRELAGQGHLVSYHAIMYFVAPLRTATRESQLAIRPVDQAADQINTSTPDALESATGLPQIPIYKKSLRLTGRLVSRLLMGNITFTPQYQAHLDQLCTALPELALTRQLATSFRTILNQRLSDQLDPWLQQAATCSLPEFHAFAESLSRDKAAVFMATLSDWSSGQVEGQVNRLKLIKRSMYGRGKLDLLRKRVLYKHTPAIFLHLIQG